MPIQKILSKFMNLLFPVKCVCCKKISGKSDGEDILCDSCRKNMLTEITRNCRRCENPPPLCKCKRAEHINQIIFPYFYSGDKIRQAIYAVKRANLYYINEFFAKGMYNSLKISDKINIGDIDFITNAPRKADSVKRYGYNQTESLAKIIAKYIGAPYLPVMKASKLYKTEQKSLNKTERAENVRNKFVFAGDIKKLKEKINGKNILIIDDVVTTGSTLSECARIMKNTGAASVCALCAAGVNN